MVRWGRNVTAAKTGHWEPWKGEVGVFSSWLEISGKHLTYILMYGCARLIPEAAKFSIPWLAHINLITAFLQGACTQTWKQPLFILFQLFRLPLKKAETVENCLVFWAFYKKFFSNSFSKLQKEIKNLPSIHRHL